MSVSSAVRSAASLGCPDPGAATSPSQQIVIDATNVLAQSVTMQTGHSPGPAGRCPRHLIIPNTLRGAFVFGVQHGRGVLVVRGDGHVAGATDDTNYRRQLWLPDRHAVDRSQSGFSHSAERGEPDARHVEGRCRCVGRRGAGGPPGIGGDRSAAPGRDPVVFACPRRSSACRSTARRFPWIRRADAMLLPTAGRAAASATQLLQMVSAFSKWQPGCGAARAADCRARSVCSTHRSASRDHQLRSSRLASCARGAAIAELTSKRGSNWMPSRANWRRISTTNGDNTWCCRRKFTSRTSRRVCRREQAIGRYETVAGIPNSQPSPPGPTFRTRSKASASRRIATRYTATALAAAADGARRCRNSREFEQTFAVRYARRRSATTLCLACDGSLAKRGTRNAQRHNTSLRCCLPVANCSTCFWPDLATRKSRRRPGPVPPAFANWSASIWCSTPICRAGRTSMRCRPCSTRRYRSGRRILASIRRRPTTGRCGRF